MSERVQMVVAVLVLAVFIAVLWALRAQAAGDAGGLPPVACGNAEEQYPGCDYS